jgi:hypothetical protein
LKAEFLATLEKEMKVLGWKKLAGVFFRDINEFTISHFTVFEKDNGLVRAQMHTTNKLLDRISWNIFGLPPNFGAQKDHLVNSTKCNISTSYLAYEKEQRPMDAKSQAAEICETCFTESKKFDNLQKIHGQIIRKISENKDIDRSIELICTAIAISDLSSAKRLIREKKEANFPGYPLSFFARAERYLAQYA